MKWKIAAVIVVVLLILAQMRFGAKNKADPAAPTGGTAVAAADGGSSAPDFRPEAPPPVPDDVRSIVIGDGEDALRLTRGEYDWSVAGRDNAPADGEKIARLLRGLLTGERRPVPLGDAEKTGLADDNGLPVSLALKSGGNYDVMIGLRPSGVYDSTYVRLPDGRVASVASDIRGDLGLWRNIPDAKPDPAAWLEKRALSFDPARAVRIEATYPDHTIVFEKPAEGDWIPAGYVPGGKWNAEGLTAWLRELSDFQIADAVPAGEFADDAAGKTHCIRVAMDDGEEKRVCVQPNHGGEGMLAVTSDHPGRVFHLPEWRFKKYFRRLPSLFPDAVPNFELSRIRFVDVRKGGETVKIARRDGNWEAVALPYSLKSGAVDRLARMLASWRPEDYAAPDFKSIRPGYGGPMVEVILEGGDVHQYRLAGRHPLFPWRYVTLDGKAIFSVTDAEAAVLFPGFADILDLGRVFRDVSLEEIDRVELADADREPLLAFFRHDGGVWFVSSHGQEIGLLPAEAERILGDLMQWRVTGFHNADAPSAKHPAQYHLRLTGPNGLERDATFLQPEERDIPYLIDGNRGYLVDRADFQNWIASAREAAHRLSEAVERAKQDEARREAEQQSATVPAVPPTDAPANQDADNASEDVPAVSDEDTSSPETPADATEEPDAEKGVETDAASMLPEAEGEAPEAAADEMPEKDAHPAAAPDAPEHVDTPAAPEEDTLVSVDDDGDAADEGEGAPEAESAPIESSEPAMREDGEETRDEPAGGDILIHPSEEVNVLGDVAEDVTATDGILVPEAAVVPVDAPPAIPDATREFDVETVERFIHKYAKPSAQPVE